MSIYNLVKNPKSAKGIILATDDDDSTSVIFKFNQEYFSGDDYDILDGDGTVVGTCAIEFQRIGRFVLAQVAGISFTIAAADSDYVRTEDASIPAGFRPAGNTKTMCKKLWFEQTGSTTSDVRPVFSVEDDGEGHYFKFELQGGANYVNGGTYQPPSINLVVLVWEADDSQN